MSEKDKSAYPSWNVGDCSPGLTKREKFAESAMLGIIANSGSGYLSTEKVVKLSVFIADALIEELKKTERDD